MANVQELRSAVKRFRDSGKLSACWTDTFGEMGPATLDYYLGSAFQKVYMQPTGYVGLTGVSLTGQFFAGTLEKLGIKAKVFQREEYKSFGEMFNQTKYTDAARRNLSALLESLYQQIAEDISKERGIPKERVVALMEKGPLPAEDAKSEKLVDELAYQPRAYSLVRSQLPPIKKEPPRPLFQPQSGKGGVFLEGPPPPSDYTVMNFSQYIKIRRSEEKMMQMDKQVRDLWAWIMRRVGKNTTPPKPKPHKIAVVYGSGMVLRGWGMDGSLSADTFCRNMRKAIQDPEVAAIILRIDSPGGSPIASDTIWAETQRAKEKGKEVIVSMGNMAASGGYYVSANASRIFANPATITGSIGVIGMRFFLRDFLKDRFGITVDSIHKGYQSNLTDPFAEGLTPEEEALMERDIDRMYHDFVGKVAAGRRMTTERAFQLAKGQIYSGDAALKAGLVDELGGLADVLAKCKKWYQREGQEPIVVEYPSRKPYLERLLEALNPEAQEDDGINGEKRQATDLRRRGAITLENPYLMMEAEARKWEDAAPYFMEALKRISKS
ncbi:Signal peptide peptidase A Serine peptidase MEROPS family S49 [Balamuthia mandrillaris]